MYFLNRILILTSNYLFYLEVTLDNSSEFLWSNHLDSSNPVNGIDSDHNPIAQEVFPGRCKLSVSSFRCLVNTDTESLTRDKPFVRVVPEVCVIC
jgi:hypothetical protein